MAGTESGHVLLAAEKTWYKFQLKRFSHTQIKKVVEPQSVDWQNNYYWTVSPCCRYVHGNSLFTYSIIAGNIWATSYLGKHAVPVKCFCGVWCWLLWGFFFQLFGFWVLNTKKPKHTTQPHSSELMEVPCKVSLVSTEMLRYSQLVFYL